MGGPDEDEMFACGQCGGPMVWGWADPRDIRIHTFPTVYGDTFSYA